MAEQQGRHRNPSATPMGERAERLQIGGQEIASRRSAALWARGWGQKFWRLGTDKRGDVRQGG